MAFGFGKKGSTSQRDDDDDDDDDDDEDEDEEEEEEIELVLFQGALNGKQPDLAGNAKLVQAGMLPAKKIVSEALSRRVEMVRLEPKGNVALSVFYVDGMPFPAEKHHPQIGLAITQVLKLLAGLDVKERSKKQSGGIKAGYLEGKYTVRVDIEPMQGGERLTLRLKNNAVKLDTPTDLGYTELLKTKIREGAGHKSGVVLAAGMPMSGVTTTAFAILRGIDAYMYTIYSLADMGGLDLMHIKNFEGNEGDDFVRTITRAKRAEADVIFVDPFRDAEFTKTIFKESDDVTFLSEIASRDSADAIERLSKWLGDPKIVAEKLKLVVGQKLIRVLCDKCKQAYRPHPTLLQKVGLPPETKVLYRMPVYVPNEDDEEDEAPPVCKKCGGVGYHGRVGLMEYIEMNEPIKQLVLSGGDAASIRALARKEKMQTFQMDGIRQIGLGKTSLEELQRVFKT